MAIDLTGAALVRETLKLDGGREYVDSMTFSVIGLHVLTVPIDGDEVAYSGVLTSCSTVEPIIKRYPKRSTKRGDPKSVIEFSFCL
eukprot:XP_001707888.1 Hypothetical protein GL50803_35090 [Giardia lamblia ATCC 50803]